MSKYFITEFKLKFFLCLKTKIPKCVIRYMCSFIKFDCEIVDERFIKLPLTKISIFYYRLGNITLPSDSKKVFKAIYYNNYIKYEKYADPQTTQFNFLKLNLKQKKWLYYRLLKFKFKN